MTVAQRELLAAAHEVIAALAQVSPAKLPSVKRARQALQIAVVRVELEAARATQVPA